MSSIGIFFFLLLQIQGEAAAAAPVRYYITTAAPAVAGDGGVVALERAAVAATPRYNGMVGTVMTIARQEGPKYVVALLCKTETSTPWRVDDRPYTCVAM